MDPVFRTTPPLEIGIAPRWKELQMGKKNLKKYDPAFKARVALEAVKEQESLAQVVDGEDGEMTCSSQRARRTRAR